VGATKLRNSKVVLSRCRAVRCGDQAEEPTLNCVVRGQTAGRGDDRHQVAAGGGKHFADLKSALIGLLAYQWMERSTMEIDKGPATKEQGCGNSQNNRARLADTAAERQQSRSD
jgi:hypothetical protein